MADNRRDYKSHIQLPKCIIKRFEKDEHCFYYNVATNRIVNYGHAKSLNTEWNYYSIDVENELSKQVEKQLGKALKVIDALDYRRPGTIDAEMQSAIRLYAQSLIARSPILLSAIDDETPMFQLFTDQSRHDLAVLEGMKATDQSRLFENRIITVLFNLTNQSLILPMSGMYSVFFSRGEQIIIPVSPDRAVVLANPEFTRLNGQNTVCPFCLLDNEEFALAFNSSAIEMQVCQSKGVVISPDRESLERAIQYSRTRDKTGKERICEVPPAASGHRGRSM